MAALPTWAYPVLVAGGFVAGIANAMAGGGSLVTLPLLVLAGLPPTVANGTNRVAILVQGATTVTGYGRAGKIPWRAALTLLGTTLLGTAAGALVATRLSDEAFRPILGVVLLVMAGVVLVRPARWLHPETTDVPHFGWRMHLSFLGIGVYAGFIQAGYGFFVLAALVAGAGLDLVRANGIKVTLAAVLSVLALAIFAWHGEVDWLAGGVLALGNGVGGYVGARIAVNKGAPWIRWVLVVMVVASGLAILRVPQAIGRLLGWG